MGLFGFFRKTAKQEEEEAAERLARAEDLEVYSGMRVEVTSSDGRMFFAAKLSGLRGDRAQLVPLVEGSLMSKSEEPAPVTMRGFSSRENKAVVLEGRVRPGPASSLYVEHLTLVKRGNDRAAFRMDTDISAFITPLKQFDGIKESCKLLNLSAGGVCVGSQVRHNVGNKFTLWAKLLPGQDTSALTCQVVRIIQRRHSYYEYGCRFLDLKPAEEERIMQIIFEMQRRTR